MVNPPPHRSRCPTKSVFSCALFSLDQKSCSVATKQHDGTAKTQGMTTTPAAARQASARVDAMAQRVGNIRQHNGGAQRRHAAAARWPKSTSRDGTRSDGTTYGTTTARRRHDDGTMTVRQRHDNGRQPAKSPHISCGNTYPVRGI